MQQKWDDLDRLIMSSNEEIEPEPGYNDRLMARVKEKKPSPVYMRMQTRITAVSLIMAGFLMMFIYTSDFQSTLMNIEYKMKTDIVTLRQSVDFGKYFLGE